MKKTLLLYGLFLGILGFVLKVTEYWFWIKLNAFDMYIALIASIFLGSGIWLGWRLQQKNKGDNTTGFSDTEKRHIEEAHTEGGYGMREITLEKLNISKREHEVLVLIGKGMSNQEIADSLFVSQNTIKTHTSRLFEKLEVKNRTHAILKAKDLGILKQ